MNLKKLLSQARIIPVITITDIDHAIPLAEALMAGGIEILEITLRTDQGLKAIEKIHQAIPECILAAGTVIDAEQLSATKEAGAQFAVSPGTTPTILDAAHDAELPLLPGVCTPSEIVTVKEFGLDLMKFFPASLFGGIKILQHYAKIFPNVSFNPTGGINLDNMQDFLNLENVTSIGGSWLTPANLIEEKNWAAITQLAKQALAKAPA